jgi:two-component sensor histidine kinase
LALALIVAFVGARVLLSRPLGNALAAAAATGGGTGQPRPTGTPQPAATAAARDNEALLALALETGNLCAWEFDAATGTLNRSDSFDAVFGYGRPVERWTWRGFLRHIVPEDRAAAEDALRRLRAGPGSVAHEVRVYREGDGDLRVLHLRATHGRAPDGSSRIFGVLADATDAMAAPAAHAPPAPAAAPVVHQPAGEQFRLSPAELSHRVRGMLATVQGIATETLRAPPGTGGLIPAAAKTAFEARLAALGRSHEVLMREDGAKADLSELVNLVLAPHAAGPAGARPTASGPALWLPAATAVPISVALHELATNAARHGALSQPKGSVAVSWRMEEVGPGHAPMLRLRWEERGGPQLEGPPRRKGFGLKLLETGLAPEIGGLVSVEFRPTGLVCEIEAPLKAAAHAVSEAV